jgi:hypothetical protein
VSTGADRHGYVEWLGAEKCAAVGNGRNDAEMLTASALGIAVIGPEGAHAAAVAARTSSLGRSRKHSRCSPTHELSLRRCAHE